MFAAFLPAVSREALKKMGQEVRRWRVNLRTTSDIAALAEWTEPSHPWLDQLLREVLPDRARRPATAHQHLPGALGPAEVQTAPVVQESQALVEQPPAQAAQPVRTLNRSLARGVDT